MLGEDRFSVYLPEPQTFKLYMPLTADFYGRDEWGDMSEDGEEWDGHTLMDYEGQILSALVKNRVPEENESGLMRWYGEDDSVDHKVRSAVFTVEVRNRQLWGVAECRVAGELTPEELTILKEYLGGQASDGWGEGFEQRPIEVDGGELYVHLWQPDDWSIQTEQERFAPKVAEGLPELCFSTLRTTGQLICIKRGETGYYPSDWDTGDKEGNVELADELNEDLGVTPIQRQAMEIGSMAGWDVPGADPKHYEESYSGQTSCDYLFGCETFYGERISWSDRLEFCGLYDRQHQALHLLDDPLPNFVSGLTEEECQDSTAFGKRIAQEVDRYVEAAISNERSRLSVRELTSERNINSYRYYKGTEAGREAASLVFSGGKPDVQFHSEYYTSLTEDTLLSYLKSPEDNIKTTAEQNMRDNQEEFLAQFLKKDALLAEYQMLSQDSDAPVYRMRAITDALQKSGAKTVNVTVQKDGVELTFKTSAESLKGLKSQYSTWYIAPSDRLQFRHLFGAGSDYSAEDIIRIAYGRSTL